MITPNKVLTLSESAIGHLGTIMAAGPEARDLVELYHDVSDKFESIDQFLLTIDTLYILGNISVDLTTRTLTYVS